MNNEYQTTDQLNMCAAQIRLIAGLMVAGNGLKAVECDAFAEMLQDLAKRMDQIAGVTSNDHVYPSYLAGDGRS